MGHGEAVDEMSRMILLRKLEKSGWVARGLATFSALLRASPTSLSFNYSFLFRCFVKGITYMEICWIRGGNLKKKNPTGLSGLRRKVVKPFARLNENLNV